MYALDTNEARKADQTGNRISEIGKYYGKFTQAEDVTARTGTKGVGLRFEANGQIANLSIYTIKQDGTTLQGNQVLMAILTCMKIRAITPQQGKVTRWDNEARKEIVEQASIFPTLINIPIGLLLETEGYWRDDGTEASRMVIAGVFQAQTELTASEILDKKTVPETLEKIVFRLHHRPAKPKAEIPHRQHGAAPTGGAMPVGQFSDTDDDIPFVHAHELQPSKARRMARYHY